MDTLGFALRDFGCEAQAFGLLSDVAWEGYDFARAVGVLFDDFGEGGLPAASDVYRCAVRAEGLAYHEPDACAAASDDGFESGDIEEFGILQVFVREMGCHCTSWKE